MKKIIFILFLFICLNLNQVNLMTRKVDESEFLTYIEEKYNLAEDLKVDYENKLWGLIKYHITTDNYEANIVDDSLLLKIDAKAKTLFGITFKRTLTMTYKMDEDHEFAVLDNLSLNKRLFESKIISAIEANADIKEKILVKNPLKPYKVYLNNGEVEYHYDNLDIYLDSKDIKMDNEKITMPKNVFDDFVKESLFDFSAGATNLLAREFIYEGDNINIRHIEVVDMPGGLKSFTYDFQIRKPKLNYTYDEGMYFTFDKLVMPKNLEHFTLKGYDEKNKRLNMGQYGFENLFSGALSEIIKINKVYENGDNIEFIYEILDI